MRNGNVMGDQHDHGMRVDGSEPFIFQKRHYNIIAKDITRGRNVLDINYADKGMDVRKGGEMGNRMVIAFDIPIADCFHRNVVLH